MHLNLKRLLCLLLFALSTILLHAQGINNFNTANPNASQSISANDIASVNSNVDMSTGRLSYAVNLKPVTMAGITIPLGVHYSTNGFKVQEMASNVGLGWSSNFSGVITRTVRGLPDEQINGFSGLNHMGTHYNNGLAQNLEDLQKSIEGTWDSEPDQYYFSFLNFSGSFVLDAYGTPQFQSVQGIKILKCPYGNQASGVTNQWVLVDQLGTQYFFGEEYTEFTHTLNQHEKDNTQQDYISSWYLKKIVTSSQQQINFSYTSGAAVSYTNYQNVKRYVNNTSACSPNKTATWSENVTILNSPLYLTKIQYQNTAIKCEYKLSREDLTNGLALTDIQLLYKDKIVNSYKLHYDYFTSVVGGGITKRLKLTEVDENLLNIAEKKLYSFFYNDVFGLPSRNSYATDIAGYFNNNTSSSNIIDFGIPTRPNPGHPSTRGPASGSPDKSPDSARTKANVLIKVKQVAGAITYFAYEGNSSTTVYNPTSANPTYSTSPAPGIRIKTIYTKKTEADATAINQLVYNYDNFQLTQNGVSSGQRYPNLNTGNSQVIKFRCSDNALDNVDEYYYYSESLTDVFDANGSPVLYTHVSVTRADGSKTRYQFTGYNEYMDNYWAGYMDSKNTSNNYFDISNSKDVFPLTSYSTARGIPLLEEQLNANGQLVKSVTYTYAPTNAYGVYGVKAIPDTYDKNGKAILIRYGKYRSWNYDLLLQTKKEVYFNAGVAGQTITENYGYVSNGPNFNLLKSKSVSLSGGKTDKYIFTYPFEVISNQPTSLPSINQPISRLVYNNIVGNPIESIHTVTGSNGEKVYGATTTLYKVFGDNTYPSNEFKLHSFSPIDINNYTTLSIDNSNGGEVVAKDSHLKPSSVYLKYNPQGLLLQSEAVEGTSSYTSTLYGYDGMYKVASVANASQEDIAYTGFESEEKGNWSFDGLSDYVGTSAAVGYQDYNLSHGPLSKSALQTAKTYILTYWTKNTAAYGITGTVGAPLLLSNRDGWNLYRHKITGVSSVTIAGSGTIDEVRLLPYGSAMTTSAYEPLVGAIANTNENNQTTFQEYDEWNRAFITRDNNKNITKAICYNLAGEQVDCFNLVPNQQQSATQYKSDCSPGNAGSYITYTVEAGRYQASTMQIANAIALNDINSNKQGYANSNGSCTVQVIYARLVLDEYTNEESQQDQDNYSSLSTARLQIQLFTDAQGTQPFTLTNSLTVTVNNSYTNSSTYNGETSGNDVNTFNMTAGSSSFVIGRVIVSNSQTYTDPYSGSGHLTDYSTYTYTLGSSNYYIIIQ